MHGCTGGIGVQFTACVWGKREKAAVAHINQCAKFRQGEVARLYNRLMQTFWKSWAKLY